MKILVLGIGNILFGDEGIGVHLANYIDEKYKFTSHQVDIIDGGTLAHKLVPIIVDYDKVFIFDCVDVSDAKIGDVYFFDFTDVPECVSWQGSAHEVEMLQTLQMVEMMGDLPPTKIVGVIPYVIGEDSTFTMTDEVVKASETMERVIIDYLKSFDIEVTIKKPTLKITDVTATTYTKGITYDIGV